ncbi:MAG TPA: very short patch repair endonuclease [Lentisphaeria bacterium]|nr:very short patch repair endonuclease [Lentisphaeria bacterium]
MDCFDSTTRRRIMQSVRSNDTTPELAVRSFLFRHGFRFRLHVKTLPGHPDIVLPKYKTVIEVRGCFWHRHPGCRQATMPSSNVEFWQKKFKRNVDRDKETEKQLNELGWNLIVVWECELKSDEFLKSLPSLILNKRNCQ